MRNLNYPALQPLSKNTQNNKGTKAEQSVECMLALLDYQNNFEELIRQMSIYDATSLIIAEQDWIKRHKFNTYKNGLQKGQVCKADFGKTYNRENAFVHYALFMGKYENKYLVIPMTTSPDEINKSFHPVDRENGEYRLRLAKESEGFPRKAALYMNDAKFISPGRVIDGCEIINTDIFPDIEIHLIKVMFPSFYSNVVKKLKLQHETLINENKILLEKLEKYDKSKENPPANELQKNIDT